jgi:hypothetical protein
MTLSPYESLNHSKWDVGYRITKKVFFNLIVVHEF